MLCRHDLNRLRHLDRQTAAPIRRYERSRPGELVHVDMKKLGRIPPGGGHRVRGRPAARPGKPKVGYAYLHTAIDDFSARAGLRQQRPSYRRRREQPEPNSFTSSSRGSAIPS